MRSAKQRQHHIDSLLALVLFGVFAACILSVLLTGAGVYQRLTQRDRQAYDQRTCAQYLAAKVRQAPGPQSVSLSSFGDGDALVITEEIAGELYTTRIYCWDGWLWELFAFAEGDFAPQDGEKVLQAQSLSLTLEDGLLSALLVDGNEQACALSLSVRGGEGAVS